MQFALRTVWCRERALVRVPTYKNPDLVYFTHLQCDRENNNVLQFNGSYETSIFLKRSQGFPFSL